MLTLLLSVYLKQLKLALRRLTAISLLLIFFFNLVGYRVLLQYWENQANTKLEAKLDKQEYDEKDLVEMKIPLTVPYGSCSKDFERYSGEIDIEGVHYKYVQRKVYNDSLVLLCIPNKEKTQLATARDEFCRMINEFQKENHGKKSSGTNSLALKFSLSDYTLQQSAEWNVLFSGENKTFQLSNVALFCSTVFSTPGQPPEYV
jgi:hypothetical protein